MCIKSRMRSGKNCKNYIIPGTAEADLWKGLPESFRYIKYKQL